SLRSLSCVSVASASLPEVALTIRKSAPSSRSTSRSMAANAVGSSSTAMITDFVVIPSSFLFRWDRFRSWGQCELFLGLLVHRCLLSISRAYSHYLCLECRACEAFKAFSEPFTVVTDHSLSHRAPPPGKVPAGAEPGRVL